MVGIIQWGVGAVALLFFNKFESFTETEKEKSKVFKKVIGVLCLAFLALTFFVFLEFGITLVIGEICLFIGTGWAIKIYRDWYDYNLIVQGDYENKSYFVPFVIGIIIFAICGVSHFTNYVGNIKISEYFVTEPVRTIIKIDYFNDDTTLIRVGDNYDYQRIQEDGSSIPDSIPVADTKKVDIGEGEEPWIEKIIETRERINYNVNPPISIGVVVITRYELHIPPKSIDVLTQKEP